MKRNVQGLVLVMLFSVQALVTGNALAEDAEDKVSLKGSIVEESSFPRSALDD